MKHDSERGQIAVEFTMLLPLLIMVLAVFVGLMWLAIQKDLTVLAAFQEARALSVYDDTERASAALVNGHKKNIVTKSNYTLLYLPRSLLNMPSFGLKPLIAQVPLHFSPTEVKACEDNPLPWKLMPEECLW